MKAKCLIGVFLLCGLSLHDAAGKPSNILYRVSPPNTPIKLEPVLYAPHFEYPSTARKQHLDVHASKDAAPKRSNQSLEPTAGRCEVQI